jgi:hypothetical protein
MTIQKADQEVKASKYDLSKGPNVYLYSGHFVKRVARVLFLALITSLLLLPVVICNLVDTTSVRIGVVLVFTVFYLAILTELVQPKTMELVVAGPT